MTPQLYQGTPPENQRRYEIISGADYTKIPCQAPRPCRQHLGGSILIEGRMTSVPAVVIVMQRRACAGEKRESYVCK